MATPTSHYENLHLPQMTALNKIRTPRVIRTMAWCMVFTVAIVFAFLSVVPWVQTSSGPGVVTALNPTDRLQEVNALVSGVIQEWYVRDGSAVKKGDPIVKIVDNDPLLLERLNAERDQVVAQLEAAKTAERTAGLDLTRSRELFEKGLAARREYEQAQIAVETRRGAVAQVAASLNRINTEISRQSVQIVRAPRDGRILRVNAGDAATFVRAGQVVASFVPDNVQRAIELYIDGRDVALVRLGQSVRIEFEGWPTIQISGWPTVALGTYAGRVVAIDPSASANGRFRVLVEEDREEETAEWPDEAFVRFGSAARGWILLGTVKSGFELWRQLNNFPPQFPAMVNNSDGSGGTAPTSSSAGGAD